MTTLYLKYYVITFPDRFFEWHLWIHNEAALRLRCNVHISAFLFIFLMRMCITLIGDIVG